MRVFTVLFILVGLFSLVGCASEPEVELQAAQQALEKARAAEADVYAQEKFDEAQQLFSEATRELQAQRAKFFFSRSYEKAQDLLGQTTALAQEAEGAASAGREQMHQQAESARIESQQLLQTAQEAMQTAPIGKGNRTDLAVLTSDLERAQAGFESAEGQLAEGKIVESLAGFKAAAAAANDVIAAVPERR